VDCVEDFLIADGFEVVYGVVNDVEKENA